MGRLDLVLVLLDLQNQEWDKVVSNYILLEQHPGCKCMYSLVNVYVDLVVFTRIAGTFKTGSGRYWR